MELQIARGGMLKLRDARDMVIEVRRGALWITEEGDTRDYYVACNPAQSLFWVYRERNASPAWHLHGIFG